MGKNGIVVHKMTSDKLEFILYIVYPFPGNGK
jgi:hypothetical protein